MPIVLSEIVSIYEHIQEQINIDYVSVVIYTSIDIDSLCSLKILSVSFSIKQKFLKGESIQYHTHPVTTYTELEAKIESAAKHYNEVKMFMFINCGGFVDLTEKWFVKERNDIKIFLFDSNKPMHHNNLEHKSIIVVDDEQSNLKYRVTQEDMKQLEELEELDIEEVDNEQSDEDQDISPKRRSQKMLIKKVKQKRQLLVQKMNNYYGSTFISVPTSWILYKFIREQKKAGNFALWYGIVGATSLYLQHGISRQLFNQLMQYYSTESVQFNPQGHQEKRERGEIFGKKGFNMPLMNHWSLYESMMNSPYLMAKLGLWKEQGFTTLHEILTKLGISLEQSKQNYKYMTKDLRESLQTKIFTLTGEYGIQDICYQSFMRQTDSIPYMASDYYYIISAEIEKPVSVTNDSKELSEEEQKLSKQQKITDQRIKAFWSAYNILEGSQDMMKKTIEQYKNMSIIMMRQVRDIIERDNLMEIGKKLVFSNIRCDTKDKKLFQHQSALMRIGHILMDIEVQKRRKSTKREASNIAYVVSLLDIESNNCLVVGVVPERKNPLGEKFSTVVSTLKVEVQHDRFMSNVIILPKTSLLSFIMQVGDKKKQ